MKKGFSFFGRSLVAFGLFILASAAFGQKIILQQTNQFGSSQVGHSHTDKCAHTILESQLEKEMGYFGSKDFFENWINQKVEANRRSPQIARMQEERRLIPVVVHVLHNGSAVGTGTNVPDSQIFEQIRILNEDFRRLNQDADRTPAEFVPVAADANIEFVLAKQDPNGLPTTGINRLQGPKTIYDPNTDPTLIGSTIQWNPEEYLNIWVVPLVQPFIGYASFPVSDLPGLNFSPSPIITDGVTIDYRFLGLGGSATSSSFGRTATHEVGHYFGLRHIWGDGGCEVDDFVTDTPNQDNPNTACNATVSRFSCGNNNMIQNYMDYTPDACMNLFTVGQVERFNVVLENSPRRVTLVNNRATQEPVLVNRDLAITKIISPEDAICDLTIAPQVEVRNAGTETLTSAQLEFLVNGQLIESKRFTFQLTTGQVTNLSFSPTTLSGTSNQVLFRITRVNDLLDEKPDNNTQTSNPILQGEITLPYTFDVNSFPGQWVIRNPDDGFTWQKTEVSLSGIAQPAVFIRHYEYDAAGQLDYFISPIIDLAKYPNAQLVFEVAHGPYNQAGFQDELIVSVAEDCGSNFDVVTAPYLKFGTRLETSTPSLNEFIPTSEDQFRTELVNLQEFQSLGKVRISITSKNAFGNNIYLKNIRILPQEEFKYELRIDEIVAPSPISDGKHTQEAVRITNTGNLPVSKFLFSRATNSAAAQTFIGSGSTIVPGEQVDLEIARSTADGKNRLAFSIFDPNFDQNGPTPVVIERFNLENTTAIPVPWRQNFNSSTDLSPWLTINPEKDEAGWTVSPSSNGTGLNNIARLENGKAGFSYWLGSPVFDLTKTRQASIFFDLAAGQVDPASRLILYASSDGGQTYTPIWSATGSELSTVDVGAANPNTPGDFQRKYVNLTEYAGPESGLTRLAFALQLSGTANTPVYLDNLELFLSANPEPVIPGEGSSILYPNPAREFFNLAFNLPSQETVTIQIVSTTGAVVQEIAYPGTLNQTYTFTTDLFRPGVYIIRISSNTLQDLKRLIIN